MTDSNLELRQLTLALWRAPATRLSSFVRSRNEAVLASVEALSMGESSERRILVAGPVASGKTHLLQAACAECYEYGKRAVYVPLGEHRKLAPEVLSGLEASALVCLDDVSAIAAIPAWERALFNLYNACDSSGCPMLFATRSGVVPAGFQLPDLASRLVSVLRLDLRALDDAGRASALLSAAERRGFDLDAGVIEHILATQARDMHSLMALLDDIDRDSLAAGKRITLPYLRRYLLQRADTGVA